MIWFICGILIGVGAGGLLGIYIAHRLYRDDRLLLKPGQSVRFWDPSNPDVLAADLIVDSYAETYQKGRSLILVDRAQYTQQHRLNPEEQR